MRPTFLMGLGLALAVGLSIPQVPVATVAGIASTYGPGFDGYLALPGGRGIHVRVSGPGGTVERVSNDAGPSLYWQRHGRVVDLDVADFETVCGTVWTRGTCNVTVAYLP
jgi:hypothetical protein